MFFGGKDTFLKLESFVRHNCEHKPGYDNSATFDAHTNIYVLLFA